MGVKARRRILWRWIGRSVAFFLVASVVVAILWPVYSSNGGSRRYLTLSNIKQLALACQMYDYDCEDRLPIATTWMDGISPYVKVKSMFNASDKEHKIPGFGFAFRDKFSGRKLRSIDEPSNVALLFESTDLSWNANGGLELLPNPGRHSGEDAIAYADGHAHWYKPGNPLPK